MKVLVPAVDASAAVRLRVARKPSSAEEITMPVHPGRSGTGAAAAQFAAATANPPFLAAAHPVLRTQRDHNVLKS
jgi:hypothetical protein